MTNDAQAPETIWATTAREGYDTLHSEWPPNEWPKEEHPFDYEPQEYILKSTSDARIAELEAAIGNALDLINADFFDEAGASLRAALGKE